MALVREIYKEFEEIVGIGNISEEPVVLETYRCVAAQSSAHYGPYDQRTPTPQAVLLPGSTEEVQKIVLLCNKHGIHFKASTTFWSAQGYIGSDNAIQLDMRRMNKIEVDAKNQLAIIEPYAIAAAIQAETMKHGMTCNIQGAGGSTSTLASTAGWQGPGPSSIFTGTNYDNMLSAEWVLPNGEILRTGSAGSGDGWFCGEGPGPSLRAIVRGVAGTAGDMGVCTKLAIKLSPWPGPTYLPSTGAPPSYKADLYENFKYYTLCFPTWEAWAEAVRMIHENRIIYIGHRQFNMFGCDMKGAMVNILSDPNKQLCDLPDLLEDEEIKKQTESMRIDVQVVIAGMTMLDMDYKEKALDEVLRMVGGWKNEMMLKPDIANWALLYLIRMGRKNLNYVYCGAYEGHFGLSRGNYFYSASLVEEASAIKREWEIKHNHMAAVGGNSSMGGLGGVGGGGGVSWEFFAHFDAHDKESIKGVCEYFNKTNQWMAQKGLGGCMGKLNESSRRPDGYNRSQEEFNKTFASTPQPEVFVYQWMVKDAFNPKKLSGSYYKTLDPKAFVEGSGAASRGVFI